MSKNYVFNSQKIITKDSKVNKQLDNIIKKCDEIWTELTRAKKAIETYENNINSELEVRKKTKELKKEKVKDTEIEIEDEGKPLDVYKEMLKYERSILEKEVQVLKKETGLIDMREEPLFTLIKSERHLFTQKDQTKQLILYLQDQLKTTNSDLESANKRLEHMKFITNELKSKVGEEVEAKEAEMKKKIKALSLKANNLFLSLNEFIDSYYPQRQVQMDIKDAIGGNYPPPPSLKGLLEILMNNALNDPQLYYQIPVPLATKAYKMGYEPYITLLYSSRLLQFHPTDPSKIRLVNYQLFK